MALTPLEQAQALKARTILRHACRTDLYMLCQVLGYGDVCREVHGPIVDALQHFRGGVEEPTSDGAGATYRPLVPLWQLEGARKGLILYPRGHLKTTIATISHSIQWILNYPDIRLLISTATGEQGQGMLREIKEHFQYNETFRALFPEYCPPDARVSDFGRMESFTVPCRRKHRKEPTCWVTSIGKVVAGWHPDVIKNSDLVDKENVKTPGGIAETISHFGHLNPLLERYGARKGFPASTGWNTVEGTRYDFGDLYGRLLKSDEWKSNAVVRGALNDDGTSIWPERFPPSELEKIRLDPTVGDWIFSAQYLNKCLPPDGGLCDPRDVAFVPARVIGELLPTLRLHATIDLAGMEGGTGDLTALTVGGFDRDGRLYVIEIHAGRLLTEDVINLIFDVHRRYPNLVDMKIEKEAHATVLLPFLQREMSKRQRFPVIWPIKRDNQRSKQHRISGLRPWFKQGIIRFSDGLPMRTRQELLDEVAQFPSQSSGVHDDVLDTLADLLQSRDGGVSDDVIADPPDLRAAQFGMPRPRDRFIGFGPAGEPQWRYGNEWDPAGERSMTGMLN